MHKIPNVLKDSGRIRRTLKDLRDSGRIHRMLKDRKDSVKTRKTLKDRKDSARIRRTHKDLRDSARIRILSIPTRRIRLWSNSEMRQLSANSSSAKDRPAIPLTKNSAAWLPEI